MSDTLEYQFDIITNALAGPGYIIIDDFIPRHLLHSLSEEFQNKIFTSAGVGRQTDFQLNETVRSDKIHWIEPETPATMEFLRYMENLRVGINRHLFMGLFDYESHFAHYAIGAFYKKHLDAFKGQSNRVLSTVLYLNEDWPVAAGGELLIYSESGENVIEKVSPVLGRLVIFLSEKFPHEVLPANRERKSIAGWFRINEGPR